MRADLQAPLSSLLLRVRPRVLGGLCLGAALVACAAPRSSDHLAEPEAPRAVLVLHGGAGTIDRASMTPELEQDYRAALEGALRAGHAVLAGGGSAMDAVEATLLPLEDSPLFNAGRGAVLTADRLCELDASVMDGGTGLAGAVAGIRTVRHPIRARHHRVAQPGVPLGVVRDVHPLLRRDGLQPPLQVREEVGVHQLDVLHEVGVEHPVHEL